MSLPTPEHGLVIRYAYLWHREFMTGMEEGIKDRPCAIIMSVKIEDKKQRVIVLPITHSPPEDMSCAIELPPVVSQKMGLDEERSWVMTNEVNRFIWLGPDLRPLLDKNGDKNFTYGLLPPSLFAKIKKSFFANIKAHNLGTVSRTE